MKTTRRGLFAWLGALTGAAAVARVAPAEAEAPPSKRPEWMRDWVPFSKRPESEAMRAGRLLAEQHARDIEASRAYDLTLLHGGTPADFRREFAPARLHNEHGLTLDAGSSAFLVNPARTGPAPVTIAEAMERKRAAMAESRAYVDEMLSVEQACRLSRGLR